jgi:EAL domain-containing protein (putative c-di-GMP-specific phosphodiesterase class I)
MVGAEALLRWRHPVEGLLTPDRFLRDAEEAGLMAPITRWIIQQVIQVAADWRRHLPADQKFFISINLSPAALRDPGLDEYVAALLKDKKVPAASLKFELTEQALVGNVAGARESLERLHGLGIQLMLDDFGTGYSSLSNLQLFPFDLMKIDCPFVDRRGVFQANMSIVAAMIQLAGSLGLTTIAEIVEGEAAAASLKAMGCRYGQGYYFSEPIESGIALQRLRSQVSLETASAAADTRDPMTVATVIVRPLANDGSRELIISNTPDPASAGHDARRDAATAETIRIRPLEETIRTRPLEETVRTRPLEEDGSATVMLSLEMIALPHGEDENEEDL